MFEDVVRKLIKEMNDEELKSLNSLVQEEIRHRGVISQNMRLTCAN